MQRSASAMVKRVSLLVFSSGSGGPKAVPLSLVARLEEVDVDAIENSNGQNLVQYRGKLMPLISLQDDFTLREKGRQPLLVFTEGNRSMGLVVDDIVDIVESTVTIEVSSERPGFIGSAIIAGKATEVVDTAYFLTKAFGDWFDARSRGGDAVRLASKRVLLVDDSSFFRNLIKPMLSVVGYNVSTVANAREALDMFEQGEKFDVVISDIEMPEMSGFELAETIRKSANDWSSVPLIALSAHTGPENINRGREAGFTDYVAKLDKDALLNSIKQTLTMGEAV